MSGEADWLSYDSATRAEVHGECYIAIGET